MADNVKPPSFFRTMMSGIRGYFKGTFVGGIVGILAGAAIGALVALALPASVIGTATVGSMALAGAATVGSLFASVGALSGMVTDVVRSRQTAYHSAADTATVANIAFTQGVAVGQQMSVAEGEQRTFRDKIEQERAAQGQKIR